jgi:hypothetical protein
VTPEEVAKMLEKLGARRWQVSLVGKELASALVG